MLCCAALTFQVKNNPPLKLSDDFCVGWVGICPLPLWGPAGRGSVCFCSLFVSLWGRSPAHQNVVFLSGPCLSVVMWTLWAKPLLFLVLRGGGKQSCVVLPIGFNSSGLSLVGGAVGEKHGVKSAFLGRAGFAWRLSQAAYVILEELLHLTEPPL